MTKHSERAIRTRMRERGIKPNASNIEAVTREVNSTERERAMRQEAARNGHAVDRMGREDAREVAAQRAAAVRANLRGGRPI